MEVKMGVKREVKMGVKGGAIWAGWRGCPQAT